MIMYHGDGLLMDMVYNGNDTWNMNDGVPSGNQTLQAGQSLN